MTQIRFDGITETGDRGSVFLEVDANGSLQTSAVSSTGTSELTYVTYTGGGFTYWCEAAPLSARSSAVWHVARKNDTTGDIIHAGTGAFDQVATDLAAVAALTYTLGV